MKNIKRNKDMIIFSHYTLPAHYSGPEKSIGTRVHSSALPSEAGNSVNGISI